LRTSGNPASWRIPATLKNNLLAIV